MLVKAHIVIRISVWMQNYPEIWRYAEITLLFSFSIIDIQLLWAVNIVGFFGWLLIFLYFRAISSYLFWLIQTATSSSSSCRTSKMTLEAATQFTLILPCSALLTLAVRKWLMPLGTTSQSCLCLGKIAYLIRHF